MDEIAYRLVNFLLKMEFFGDFRENPILQPDQRTKRAWAQDYVVKVKTMYEWE